MQYTTKQHEQANSIISSWVRMQKVKALRSVVPENFKHVINGKTYNCSSAKHLTSFTFHDVYEESNTVFENLYLTPKGEYFLCGEGMERTPYAAKMEDRDDWMRGHGILSLTLKQVKEWGEIRCLEDEIEDILSHSV